MGSNRFGLIFTITTWGESHGPAIGVVIDGCPAGLDLSEEDLIQDLKKRAPGQAYTTPRVEADNPFILSGIFEGKTTGTPISIMIKNLDAQSKSYDSVEHLIKPGHANGSYLAKYGIFDYRGGGRASARETACRVAAGGVAKKVLRSFNISCHARIAQVGSIVNKEEDWRDSKEIIAEIERARAEGDSLGGVVEFIIDGMIPGIGDPVYEKLESNLAKAMLSIPASRGFEIGEGFKVVCMAGSEHNRSNEGILGGISTGAPIRGAVAFKPTSSIKKPQNTVNLEGKPAIYNLPEGSRHDPCVALRAAPIVEAMAALVIVDGILLNRCSRL
jgi:chorismate synthase